MFNARSQRPDGHCRYTAVMPSATEVKVSAPLSSFASAGAPKPNVPSADMWEMIGMDGGRSLFEAASPNSEITGVRSPTYPPTSLVVSKKGNGDDPPCDDEPDEDGPKGGDKRNHSKRDKGGKRPVQGCRRPPGGGPGDGDDDDDDDNRDGL